MPATPQATPSPAAPSSGPRPGSWIATPAGEVVAIHDQWRPSREPANGGNRRAVTVPANEGNGRGRISGANGTAGETRGSHGRRGNLAKSGARLSLKASRPAWASSLM